MGRLSKSAVAIAAWLTWLGALAPVLAQQPSEAGPPIDGATRTQIIDHALKLLNEHYLSSDIAKAVERDIRDRLRRGEYDKLTRVRDFTNRLTEDMRAVSKDQHMGVLYAPGARPDIGAKKSEEERREARRRELRWGNYGFEKVERLGGNVGYLELTGFTEVDAEAQLTASAAMNFVTNTNALIIDLRGNSGGTYDMVTLIASYLFGPERVHLNDIRWREGNRTQELWTSREVAGRRYTGRDVYILTSRRTFSAAEELAYDLQVLKRATVVGERTGGGANPGVLYRFLNDYWVYVSEGRAVNPTTKTNWEGTGVKPDVEVPAEQALTVARLMALKKSLPTLRDARMRQGVQEEINQLEKELSGMNGKK